MRKAKLNFGERMREWRKARKEYADKVKNKIKEQQDIDSIPKIETKPDTQVVNLSPTKQTEMKEDTRPAAQPLNHIDMAILKLREQADRIR